MQDLEQKTICWLSYVFLRMVNNFVLFFKHLFHLLHELFWTMLNFRISRKKIFSGDAIKKEASDDKPEDILITSKDFGDTIHRLCQEH